MSESPEARNHGSRSRFVTAGLFIALAVNVLLGAGMLVTRHLESDAIAAEAGAGTAETPFQCRWMETGRFHQVEVAAATWQAAEAKACGTEYRGVRLPPLLSRGYGRMVDDPMTDPFLIAQRESCSCSDHVLPPILQDVLIEAPRLGIEMEKRALPRLPNKPEEVERNVVAPQLEPKPAPPSEPEPKEAPKPRKKVHEPDLDALLQRSETFDEARPANQDSETGVEWGSRNSTSQGVGDLYLQKVKARLDNSLQAPSSIPRSELGGLTARVTIKIGANGKVWGWSWRSKSGNEAFDAMVERTLERFEIGGDSAFAAPPDDWVLAEIPIKVDGAQVR